MTNWQSLNFANIYLNRFFSTGCQFGSKSFIINCYKNKNGTALHLTMAVINSDIVTTQLNIGTVLKMQKTLANIDIWDTNYYYYYINIWLRIMQNI